MRILVLPVLLMACSSGGGDLHGSGNGPGDVGPQLNGPLGPGSTADEIAPGVYGCAFNQGVDDLWRLSNGIPPDLATLPTPGAGWSSYFDPDSPLLAFFYPPDWTPTRLADGTSLGVALQEPGTEGLLVLNYVLLPRGDLKSDFMDATEIANLGADSGRVMCRLHGQVEDVVGHEATLTAIRDGDRIVFVQTATVYDLGNLGYGVGVTVNASVNLFVGEAGRFASLTRDVFLPILYQFYRGGGTTLDSDGDGVSDDADSFPYDSTRS